jgi:hypothetical protein
MKSICTLVMLSILSTALVTQLNAQLPEFIQTVNSTNYINDLQKNDSFAEFEFYTPNDLSVKDVPLKIMQSGIELLDSVVYLETYLGQIYNGNKRVWEYDSEGNKTHFSSYFWSSSAQEWRGIQRLDSAYDANGRVSRIIRESWNIESKKWVFNEKNEISYNTDGEIVVYNRSAWNSTTGEWNWNLKQESTHTHTDENEHFVVSTTFVLDLTTDEWKPQYRNEINYDAKGNRTLYNASLYDAETNSFVFKTGSFKYEDSYDENGNRTSSGFYRWDAELGQWKGQNNLVESSYDVNGNATLLIVKKWDNLVNQWVNNTKSESSFTENGLLLQHIAYQWDGSISDWVAADKTVNSFNDNGALIGEIKAVWNREEGEWEVKSQKELIYNDDRKLYQLIVLSLDPVSNEWFANTKDEYTYDATLNVVLKEQYKRNDNDQWVVFKKAETSYDVYGNVVLKVSYELDEESGDFSKVEEIEYTYDGSGAKLLESSESIYFDGVAFVMATNYYYSIHSITTDIVSETAVQLVYPNPFADQLSVQLNGEHKELVFELFNSNGSKVMSRELKSTTTLSVADLPGGVYFYKLSIDNKILRGKLIKN